MVVHNVLWDQSLSSVCIRNQSACEVASGCAADWIRASGCKLASSFFITQWLNYLSLYLINLAVTLMSLSGTGVPRGVCAVHKYEFIYDAKTVQSSTLLDRTTFWTITVVALHNCPIRFRYCHDSRDTCGHCLICCSSFNIYKVWGATASWSVLNFGKTQMSVTE